MHKAREILAKFKARFGTDGWECEDIPPAEGETPILGIFVKQRCRKNSSLERSAPTKYVR